LVCIISDITKGGSMNSEIDEDIAWSPMMMRNMEKAQIIRDNDLIDKAKNQQMNTTKRRNIKKKKEKR